ncbi:alanyl-tRNA editing protein [Thermococcus sp.]
MTERLFYTDPYLKETTAKILKVEREDGKLRLLLDRTIFYPEGGGQPSDRGLIEGEGFRVHVENVSGKDEIWHEGRFDGRLPVEGETVRLVLDWEWRYENMRAHTGQHILSAVIEGLYGAGTTGFQIFEDHCKIEIDYPGELTWDMVSKAEELANEVVWGDIDVEVELYDELPLELENRLRKSVSEKVKPPIRIVRIGTVDVTPCGGTHVRNTREIGIVKVLRFYRKSRKFWRIEFATGKRALKALDDILEDYWVTVEGMPNKNRPLLKRVAELKAEMEFLESEKDSLRRELWKWKGAALISKAEDIGGIRLVSHIDDWPMKDAQAFAIYFVDKNPGTVLLIAGENYVVFAKNREVEGISMVELLRMVLGEVGGGGGGSENLARGGGFRAPPEKVLELAGRIIKEQFMS